MVTPFRRAAISALDGRPRLRFTGSFSRGSPEKSPPIDPSGPIGEFNEGSSVLSVTMAEVSLREVTASLKVSGVAPGTDSLDSTPISKPMAKNPYKKYAGQLKRLGLIDYDMRKTLSSSQKANITKKVAEYGHFLKHPELFYAPHVYKKRAKELKTSGYKVTPSGRAIIPLKEFTSARLGKGSIVFKNGDLTEDVKLVGAKNFHNELKKLAGMKLTRHQMITVKIGDNGSFKRSFTSYAELHNYLAHEFSPKDSSTKNRLKRVNELMPKMSIVTVTQHAKKKTTRKKPSGN